MLTKIIIGFVCFLFVVFFIEWLRKNWKQTPIKEKPEEEIPQKSVFEDVCCGQHDNCEKERLPRNQGCTIEYYDDDELDVYKGRTSDQYSEEEVESFRIICYSLQEEDMEGWLQSLQMREIELPDTLKDEVILLLKK